jgi:hypothetical protein
MLFLKVRVICGLISLSFLFHILFISESLLAGVLSIFLQLNALWLVFNNKLVQILDTLINLVQILVILVRTAIYVTK